MQQKDIELVNAFFNSMGIQLGSIEITCDDALEMTTSYGRYAITKQDDGFCAERLERDSDEDMPFEFPIGIYRSLPRALTHIAIDMMCNRAQVFFEPYAEDEYGLPALDYSIAI